MTAFRHTSDMGRSRSPTQPRGGLRARPRRTPVKPNPRPLPPPGPDDEDEILNPFVGRALRRSPRGGLPEPDPQEPDLPPTPVHLDNVASTPPTGIHSTPSRRPRRSRALAEKVRSSPTKQPPEKPAGSVFHPGDENILPTTEAVPKAGFGQPQATRKVDSGAAKSRPRPRPSEARGVQRADANAKKRRERDALLGEIAQLERDLEIVVQENDRVGQLLLSGKEVAMPSDATDILDVLGRHLAPRRKETSTSPSDAWLQAALDPVAFLPFGKPSSSLPTLFPEDSSAAEPQKEPISHHPVPMTAQEALPFLQAFTPLKFTSRIRTLPPPTPDPASSNDESSLDPTILQHHSIAATSDSAPGLFLARIDLTVDTKTHAVASLAAPRIEPAIAAAELAPLAAKILASGAPDGPEGGGGATSGLSRNVGVLTWAMASWLRVAVRRAKTWRALDRELDTADAAERTVERVGARAARTVADRRRLLKRRWRADGGVAGNHHHVDDGGEGAEAEAEDVGGEGVAEWSVDSLVGVDELLPYLDRQYMDFRVPGGRHAAEADTGSSETDVPVLRVQWRIEFDWTGEATSRVRAMARLPGKCTSFLPRAVFKSFEFVNIANCVLIGRRADERSTLGSVPVLFDKLLRRSGGVVPAVETIVTLLAGDQGR